MSGASGTNRPAGRARYLFARANCNALVSWVKVSEKKRAELGGGPQTDYDEWCIMSEESKERSPSGGDYWLGLGSRAFVGPR